MLLLLLLLRGVPDPLGLDSVYNGQQCPDQMGDGGQTELRLLLVVLGLFAPLLGLDPTAPLDGVLSLEFVKHCGGLLKPLLGMLEHR